MPEPVTLFTAPKMTLGLISLFCAGAVAWATIKTDIAVHAEKLVRNDNQLRSMQTSVSSIDVINANQVHVVNSLKEIKEELTRINRRLDARSVPRVE